MTHKSVIRPESERRGGSIKVFPFVVFPLADEEAEGGSIKSGNLTVVIDSHHKFYFCDIRLHELTSSQGFTAKTRRGDLQLNKIIHQ
jgi:hypothetical protein